MSEPVRVAVVDYGAGNGLQGLLLPCRRLLRAQGS